MPWRGLELGRLNVPVVLPGRGDRVVTFFISALGRKSDRFWALVGKGLNRRRTRSLRDRVKILVEHSPERAA